MVKWVQQTLLALAIALAAQGAELDRTNLMAYADEQGQVRAVRSVADWQKRRAAILEAMQKVMGPLPGKEKRCPLDVQIEEEKDCGTYLRQKLTYASEPNGRVPAYLLIPKDARDAPAVLGLHQTHRLGNKVVMGLGDSPDDAYGVALAERGFVVLAPAYPLLADYNPDLKQLGYQSGTMKAIWDNIRGLDLLASLPFVRTNGFGATGHSLGGHNSVYTAVFDERVKVVVTSCGLDSYRDYMDGNIKGWTSTRYMPKLLDYPLTEIPFDFHEMIGALAPRTCFISAPYGDTNFKWKSVDAVAAAARKVYELHGVPERLIVKHPECGHRFPPEAREDAYRIIEQVLRR
jgi:glucuronyl esterase-like protein